MPFNRTYIYNIGSNFGPDWDAIAGVYIVLNGPGEVVYVGETDNFRRRHGDHFTDKTHLMHSHRPTHVAVEVISNEWERKRREQQLILEYTPPCNKRL